MGKICGLCCEHIEETMRDREENNLDATQTDLMDIETSIETAKQRQPVPSDSRLGMDLATIGRLIDNRTADSLCPKVLVDSLISLESEHSHPYEVPLTRPLQQQIVGLSSTSLQRRNQYYTFGRTFHLDLSPDH